MCIQTKLEREPMTEGDGAWQGGGAMGRDVVHCAGHESRLWWAVQDAMGCSELTFT